MKKHDYNILAISKSNLPLEMQKNEWHSLDREKLQALSESAEYGIRDELEIDFTRRQFIPYIAMLSESKVLVYKRSSKGAENRLHEKYSLGVGGHVDEEPNFAGSFNDLILHAAEREVEEEIGLDIDQNDLQIVGSIHENSNEVSQVHMGIACTYQLPPVDIHAGEDDVLVERKLMTKEEIIEIYPKLESWSQLFFDNYLSEKLSN